MSDDIVIRCVEEGDEIHIVKLLNQIFKKWPVVDVDSPLNHWIWKYRDNPIKTRNFLVALSGDEIIGVFGLLSNHLKIRDKIILCNSGVDVGIRQDYRGKGIYSTIRRSSYDLRSEGGYVVSYGVETNPILLESNMKGGDYRLFPFTARQDFKIFDIGLHYKMKNTNKKKKKTAFNMFSTYTSAQNWFRKNNGSNKDISITEIQSFDSRIDVFWSKIKNEHDFIFEKNQSYLNWRYFDPRGGKYLVKILEKDDEIIGYIVMSTKSKQEYPEGYIVELLTLSEYRNAKNMLIIDAINYFKQNKINNIKTVTVLKHSNEKTLKKHMFIKGQPIHLNYNINLNDETLMTLNPIVPDRIHFSYGDYDFI